MAGKIQVKEIWAELKKMDKWKRAKEFKIKLLLWDNFQAVTIMGVIDLLASASLSFFPLSSLSIGFCNGLILSINLIVAHEYISEIKEITEQEYPMVDK